MRPPAGRRLRPLAPLGAAAVLVLALGGCQLKDTAGNEPHGKVLFVQKCGSCHKLARADTNGVTGPNLDEAFQQARRDGYPRDTIRGIVLKQILLANPTSVMPAKLVTGSDARDVASYVAEVAAESGKDSGALANAVPTVNKKVVSAQGGKLEIDAVPSGQLAYVASGAKAKAGKLTITMKNASSTGHNIALKGAGVNQAGPVVAGGKTSTITVPVKPGKYTFFCTVPGHEQGGMKGTLTVG